MTNQGTGINVRDANHVMFFQVLLKACTGRFTTKLRGEVVYNQAADFWRRRLLLIILGAIVTDVGGSVDNNLPKIRGICINFLITRHSGVETNLPSTRTLLSDCFPFDQ